MKYISIFILLFAANASAEQQIPCAADDYQLIEGTLSGDTPVQKGSELKSPLIAILRENAATDCRSIRGLGGIPGNQYRQYLIAGPDYRYFKLSIVKGGVEQPGLRVYISKK